MSIVARLAVLFLAVGALALAPGSAAAQQVVTVSLLEWGITANPAIVQEGTVTFQVTNNGAIYHNFVVIKDDRPPGGLPVLPDGLVDESQLNVVASTSEFWTGESGSTTVGLSPGNYVLICNNQPAHYTAGMYQGFQVTAAPAEPTATLPAGATATPPTGDGVSAATATPTGQIGGMPTTGYGPQEEPSAGWWALAALAAAGTALLGLGAATYRRVRRRR